MQFRKKIGKICPDSLIEAGFKKVNIEDKSLPPSIGNIYWYELNLGEDEDLLLITDAKDYKEKSPKFFIEIFECGGLGRCFNEDEMWDLLRILTKNKDIPVH